MNEFQTAFAVDPVFASLFYIAVPALVIVFAVIMIMGLKNNN